MEGKKNKDVTFLFQIKILVYINVENEFDSQIWCYLQMKTPLELESKKKQTTKYELFLL